MPAAINEDKIQQIIEIYTTENVNSDTVAKRVGVSKGTVLKYLRLNNIKAKYYTDLVCTEEIKKQILELYQAGYMINKIHEIVGLSKDTISKILRKNNFVTNSHSDRRYYSVDQDYFKELDTNNKLYVIGLMYADGNVSKNNYTITLALQERDKEILEKIRVDMKSEKPLEIKKSKIYNSNWQDQWALIIHSKIMHHDLAQWGIIPNKTYTIKYPEFLTEEYQHAAFLRGAFDGDGSLTPYTPSNCHAYICGTYDFCYGIKEVVESFLNIHVGIIKDKNIYRAMISGKRQIKKFLDWIYFDAELYLNRKYELYCRDYKDQIA